MKRNIICVLTTILFLSTFASAQFKLKIPKIPKVNKEKLKVPDAPGNMGSSNGKNRQMMIDDGFTFFEATPVTERSAKLRGDISKGWTLTAKLRAFGTFPDQSSFKLIVSQNGKALATYLCVGKAFRKGESPVREVKNSPDDDNLSTNTGGWCGRDEKILVKDPGKYDVQVFAVNGDTDKETPLRTYKIDVKEAKKIRPGGIPGESDFYINRHAETAAAFLYLRPSLGNGRMKQNYHDVSSGSTRKGNVEIYFNVAFSENTNSLGFKNKAQVRCFANGERVKFMNGGDVNEAAVIGDTAKYARDGKPTEYIGFWHYFINLPIKWRKDNSSDQDPDMASMPGEWKCDLRDGPETIRTFKWTVSSDGFPQEHPEQTSGNINLHWGAYLIETEFPAGGGSLDQRLMPLPNAGVFYGIPWKTPEGKKMGAAVPTKGTPYVMP